MIETVANSEAASAQQAKPATRDDTAPEFSFSTAMIALEVRASTSLTTFGATPTQGMVDQKTQSASGAGGETRAASQEPSGANVTLNAHDSSKLNKAHLPENPPQNAKEMPQPPLPAQLSPPAAPLIAAASAAAITAQSSAPAQTARVEATTLREAALAKTSSPKAARPVQQAQASAPTQNFAHFLAKKLDSGATSFELRLDPPQLGRVDAHLTVSDDGEAVMSLQFENQDALDLFSRDEAGLRNALSSFGQDVEQHQFTFSLRDNADEAKTELNPTVMTASQYEPVFAAPFSTGAVDLRL